LREFQNIKKFIIFWKKHDFEKGMFPMLALIEISQKRLDLMENRVSFSIWRNYKCAQYILEVTLSARVQFTLPVHFSKIKQSHMELVFLFLLCLFFCLSLILSLLVLFFTLHFVKHKEKDLKCKWIWKLLSCCYFPCSGWHK